MSKPEPKFSWDEIEALRTGTRFHEPGPPWFNAKAYAERFGITESKARWELRTLQSQGNIKSVLIGRRRYYAEAV